MRHPATIVFALIGVLACNRKADTASPNETPDAVACTQEAKLCPDGSSVGREGPHCEFAACPEATDEPTDEPSGGSQDDTHDDAGNTDAETEA